MLAAPSEPLKLADGRLVYPDGSIVDPSDAPPVTQYVEIPSNLEAQKLVTSARRKLADLPDVPKTMNTVSVVLSYALFGLDDVEIALATGMSETQVGIVKMHAAYQEMHDAVVGSIIASETDDVRQLFQVNARRATNTLLDVLARSKSEVNKISVARDILDRAGHRPADVVEHRHKLDGALTINIVTRDKNAIPTIDLEAEITE